MIEQIRIQLMLLAWWWDQRRTRFGLWVAHRLPHNIVYWAVIRAVAHVSKQNPTSEVPALLAVDLLDAWGYRE